MLPIPWPWSYGLEHCWSERGWLPRGNATSSGDCTRASEPTVRGGMATRGTGPRNRGKLCNCSTVRMRRVMRAAQGSHWGFCECFLTEVLVNGQLRQPNTYKTTQGPRSYRCEDLAHYHQANDHAQLKWGINGEGLWPPTLTF